MHIAYLLSAFHSATGGGGAESYVSTMAEALAERGHRVSIIALGEPGESEGRVKVKRVPSPRLHWYIYRSLPFAKGWAMPVRAIEWSRRVWGELAEMHRNDSIDVVEAGENLALRPADPNIPPVVIRGHGNSLSIKQGLGQRVQWGDRFGRKIELKGIRRAQAITAVSKFKARELAAGLGLPESAVRVIPNPISRTLLEQAQAPQPVRKNQPTVLYTGRIEINKGSLDLLSSVKTVARSVSDVQYMLAGGRHNSVDERALENALGRNGARGHVRLLGHVPWRELADCYRRATVFAMPSYIETFGISVIEAMAFGLPVVATNVGGLPEVVEDGVTGILVPAGDSAALAEALIRMLRDADLRERMGRAGREKVLAEFTVDRIVDETLAVYESVRSEAGSRN